MLVVVVVLTLAATNALFVLLQMVSAPLLGARVQRVGLFAGPGWRGSVCGVAVRVGFLPLSSSVTMSPRDDPEASIHALSHWRHALLVVTPWLLSTALCTIVLGLEAPASVGRGLLQVAEGAIFFFSVGQELLTRLDQLYKTRPWWEVSALLVTKWVALNMLPLRGMAGGEVVAILLNARERESSLPLVLLPLIIPVGWCAALLWFWLG